MSLVPASRTDESDSEDVIRVEQPTIQPVERRAVIVFVFATTMWFDSSLALARPDSDLVTTLLQKLDAATGLQWSPGPSSSRLDWYDDDLGGPPLFPYVLATCAVRNEQVNSAARRHGFAVNALRIELSDLGCAAVVLDIRRIDADASPAQPDDSLLRRLAASLREEIDAVAASVTAHIERANFDDRFGISPKSLARLAPRPPVDPGNVMWTVTAWLLAAPTEQAREAVQSEARSLVPDILETANAAHSQYYFGTMACAAVVPSVDGPDATALIDVVSAMHHWWSGSWLLDALMMSIFARSNELLSGATLEELELLHRDLGRLHRLSSAVPLRVDTFLLGTSSAQYAIWSGLAGAWALDHNLRAIDSKGRDLAGLIGAVEATIRNLRDKGVARVLGVFTGVSVISGLISVTVFVATQSLLDNQNLTLRFSIAMGLTLSVVMSFVVGKYARRGVNR